MIIIKVFGEKKKLQIFVIFVEIEQGFIILIKQFKKKIEAKKAPPAHLSPMLDK